MRCEYARLDGTSEWRRSVAVGAGRYGAVDSRYVSHSATDSAEKPRLVQTLAQQLKAAGEKRVQQDRAVAGKGKCGLRQWAREAEGWTAVEGEAAELLDGVRESSSRNVPCSGLASL